MNITRNRFPNKPAKDYRSLRSDIRSGDILLCSGTATFSKLIQKATRSVWSHVAFVIRLDSIDRVMVLESVESVGVRTVPLSHYVRNYKQNGKGYPGKLLLARHDDFVNINDGKLKKMSQFAVDLFGYPYDRDEIIRIAARITSAALGFSPSEFRRDSEYICSEYAWECYKKLGIKIKHDSRGFISPAEFASDPKVKGVAVMKVE